MRRSIFIALCAVACGELSDPAPGPRDESSYRAIELVPDRVWVAGPGGGRSIAVLGRTQDGALVPIAPEAYAATSLAEQIAMVRGGRVVGLAAGSTRVRIEAGGATAELAVEVGDAPPFAAEVLELRLGDGGGFGAEHTPPVVLGPPSGGGAWSGGTDVISLGVGGRISVGFGPLAAYDGPGPDLIVFENAFFVAGGDRTFAEPGVVEIARGADPWHALPCDAAEWPFRGCAGVQPVIAGPSAPDIAPLDVDLAGGDAFDLAGLASMVDRVRITDAGGEPSGATAGFDLDAVAVIHAAPRVLASIATERSELSLRVGESVSLPRVDGLMPGGETLFGLHAALALSGEVALFDDGVVLRAVRTGTGAIVFSFGPHRAELFIEVLP